MPEIIISFINHYLEKIVVHLMISTYVNVSIKLEFNCIIYTTVDIIQPNESTLFELTEYLEQLITLLI